VTTLATRTEERLARYREMVADWDRFLDAHRTPEPATLRVRSLLHSVEAVREALTRQGFSLSSIPGLPDALRVDQGPHSVAQTLEHWLGHFHIQQCVMSLPTLALDPLPGERVLDLCAAPGGKTSHIAERMEDRGCLVAVDPKEKRLRGLMANLFRLGHPNILVIASDGREIPLGAQFDRVLVDAPCSAEGNVRKQAGRLPPRTPLFERYIIRLQEGLLRRAIQLTRPGGTIVYSTCTYAPEENEGVVARVLEDSPVEVEAIPLTLPHEPGISSWRGIRFPTALQDAWRVYPQHLNSGGLFMVRLRKLDDRAGNSTPDRNQGWSPLPAAFPGEEEAAGRQRVARALNLLEGDYGFGREWLDTMGWMVRAENLWTHTLGEWPVDAWKVHKGWRVVSAGLRAFREEGGGLETPSNTFLTRFASSGEGSETPPGPRWRFLDRRELAELLSGGALSADHLPAGPTVLVFQGQILGRGRVGRGGLKLEIPAAQARRLEALLGD